jgi:ABC-2 type transport system permease protein
VTGVTLATSPRNLAPTAHHPSMVLMRRMSRVAGRSGALWGVVFAVFIVVQMRGYTSTYRTQASRDQLAHAYGTNSGLNALIGLPHAMNTVAGWAEWRFIGILGAIGCIWGLLISTRLMRGEEEAGRYELLLAGQTTRLRAGCNALAGLGMGLLALFAFTALGTIVSSSAQSVGFSLSRCLVFSLALVAGAAMFLAIGALASQLVTSRRLAASIAGVVFGVSFALRMVGDSSSGLHWLVWLSPLGWIEQFHPLTDPAPLAMLPVLGLILLTTAITLRLAGTRDVGAATLPERSATKARLALLGGSTGFALRLMRPVALGWLFAVAAFSALIGTTAASSTNDVAGTKGIETAVERLGGHGSSVADYLGLTFLILALLVALISAGQITAIRTEEADGHLENLLVRPKGRISWFAGRLGLAALLLFVAGILSGIGAWAGAGSQHGAIGLGSLLAAGVNIVPPGVLILGLGALAIGAWPRRTGAVVYGYLAWSFLLEFAGGVIQTSHWLLDTSAFFHMVPAPATNPDWSSAAVITGLGAFGAMVGCLLFHRRDLASA